LRRLLTVRRSGEIIATANREFERGNRDQALQQLLQLRDKIPTTDSVWIALAGMYLKLNRKADALTAIQKAVELNPSNKRKGSGGLPKNPTFDPLKSDPEWIRIMTQ
jgi:cytochrome c-type biogenesis protein CcmH/NrfG